MRTPASIGVASTFLCALFLAGSTASVDGATEPSPDGAPRPNIIVILSDDMGFSDIGCYGGEIRTPVLDRLARGGLRFTQFYNTARCCPTRASLITGLYPHQAGVGWMMTDRGHDGYRGDLNRRSVTIAEVLKGAGYATYMTGKWHVTKHTAPEGPKHNWPLQRGFDRFYGTITGAGSFFDPSTLTRDNTQISPLADPEYRPERYYYTDAISDNAVRYIADHRARSPDRPFFLYVTFTAAHWPMHALPEDIARYRGVYDAGYAAIRMARLGRLRELGLIDPSWDLSPRAGDWEDASNKEWEARCMEVYAAMVDRMDQGIGRIVRQLEKESIFDQTLVFFLQDNGGCAEGLGRRPRGGITEMPEKPTLSPMAKETLQRDMIPKQTRDGYPFVMGPGVMPGPDGTYIAYGKAWANVSNTPFREYKHWVHEGGISTPLIVSWPDGVQRRGELERQPGHLIDIMATCVDVAGAEYPVHRGDEAIQPMEGRSLVPAFAGRAIDREAIYFEHESNRAIRAGKWKLVAKGDTGPWELYDMERDRTEMHDLAARHPERVRELAARWQSWAERANVLPVGTWRGKPAETKLSTKKRFALKPGAVLGRAKAPMVAGKAFSVTVAIRPPAGRGVLVAQGGSSAGWSLYLDAKAGRLVFATRHGGRLTEVASDGPLPAGARKITAQLAEDGSVTLRVGEDVVASGKVPGPLSKMPQDGLEVGLDDVGLVGSYEAANAYSGTIERVRVVIE